MGADASIYSQFLRPVRSVTDYSADMDQSDMRALQIQGQRGQNALMDVTRQGQAQAAQAAMEDRNAIQRVVSTWQPNTPVAERAASLRSTGRQAGFALADQLETQDGTRRKTDAEIADKGADAAGKTLEQRIQKYETAIRDIAAFDAPQQAMQALQAHAQAGDIDPQRAQMVAQTIPQDPAKFGAWQLGMLRRIMAAKDQMAFVQPDANTVANNATSRDNNRDTNATSRSNNAAQVGATVRGQNLTDARARDGMAQTDRLAAAKAVPAQEKPLPPAALKMQQDALDKIGIASSINADLGAVGKQIESGKLKFGPVSNLANSALNATGLSTEESRNFSSFKSTLERLRNESLRLNTGVQTDGDAQRAWNELFQNINDTGLVKQRLKEIQGINARAAELQRLRADSVRANYGMAPVDAGAYQNQPAALNVPPDVGALLNKYGGR